jgi:hypothetical protein
VAFAHSRLNGRDSRIRVVLASGIALAVCALFVTPTGARGAVPIPLLRIPVESAARGSEGGQLNNPRDIAGDPNTGHLFAPDSENARINEYTAWGDFVKAWGWDVAPVGAPGNTLANALEVCTTSCQAGSQGFGPGQLNGPRGVAVDGGGSIFLYEGPLSGDSYRVQKFDSDGNWLLMFGGEVNKTTSADICTRVDVEGGDECGTGVPGTADGSFSNPTRYSFIAYGPSTDTIFVGDAGRIQEFDTAGNFLRGIPLPGVLAGKMIGALDVDNVGDFYLATFATLAEAEEDVHKLDASGKEIQTFQVPRPESVAVDVEGHVYVVNDGEEKTGETTGNKETRKYLPDGTLEGTIPGDAGVVLRTVATNFCSGSEPPGDLYAVNFSGTEAYVNAYGSGPVGCEPPPMVEAEIEAQYTVSVGTEEAVARAEINPNFFTDTTYFLEYGTMPCSGGGCTRSAPVVLTSKVTNQPVRTAGVVLGGLRPDTTYFFRFVADNGGGGPVAGPDSTFRTFAQPQEPPPCVNEDFREGPGTLLPDCRAYEMVSPVDKNNGDIFSSFTVEAEPTAVYQAAVAGERFSYSSARSFGDPTGAPFTSQYMAGRDPLRGWTTSAISPLRTRVVTLTDFQKNQFKAFSNDLCLGWLRHDADPPLTSDALAEYGNLYRRENCRTDPTYRAITTASPEDRVPVYQNILQQLTVELQGISEDGVKAIFTANDNLEDTEAPDIGESTEVGRDNFQLYEHTAGGTTRFVCILPSGATLQEACAAGTSTGVDLIKQRLSNIESAISADGSRVFWTAAKEIGPGRIYVRIDGTSTVAISVPVSADPARFWGAANDGSVAVYSFTAGPHQGELYEFEVDAKTSHLIAKGIMGVMGMSEDASRVYFASTEVLDAGATSGEPNLYLYERGGGTTFIATLPSDEGNALIVTPIAAEPANRPARVSPDGLHAAFASKGSLTGFDNADAVTGQPDTEVYLYDAASDSLACVSCNPTNARPTGQKGVAATIPAWERSLYASRALSEDGNRVFFESFEALVLRDTNGVRDVYQWEAEGTGTCSADDTTFNEGTGGCVELISSGKSSTESVFLDATPDGSDVFITTLSSLVSHDPDFVDVYDARVGGGFPPPGPEPAICEGEACQSPRAAPEAPTPASALSSPGNPKAKPRCPKGKRAVKRRGKVRCAKKRRRGAKGL